MNPVVHSKRINARHGAAKPQNTVQAENSVAKLWKVRRMAFNPGLHGALEAMLLTLHLVLQRYCEQEAHKWRPHVSGQDS